jgi:hypothetical protein
LLLELPREAASLRKSSVKGAHIGLFSTYIFIPAIWIPSPTIIPHLEIEFDPIAEFDGVLVAAAAVDPELRLVDEARKVASVLDGVVVVDGFVVPALSELADFVAKGPPVAVLGELSLLDLSTTVSTHFNNTYNILPTHYRTLQHLQSPDQSLGHTSPQIVTQS